ncbi:DNA-protecting protein DprA [Candidatus Parcubacteria bacterium]|nr:MAG: DNA-protecting protein DprA [Candidatus Parcubacteria bacterium]
MDEELFYNAVNIGVASNYHELLKRKTQKGTWKKVWDDLPPALKTVDPETEWRELEKAGSRLLLEDNPDYPPLLREIHWKPFGIYIRGNIPESSGNIAIVGTRKATDEGKEIAGKFASALAEHNCCIISGLAFGIDAAAHDGCMRSGGKTVAVLGNGLDHVYPRTHERLGQKIIDGGGALISEYPLGSPSLPYRFLERNRIISGLSRGVLVIEAPDGSGALVTARFATDENRDVFVIPGPVHHPNYRGSNRLIRAGAELVTCPEEILEALGVERGATEEKDGEFLGEERVILEALRASPRPLSVDTIIERTNLDARTVHQTLSFLLIRNIVKETESGYTSAT